VAVKQDEKAARAVWGMRNADAVLLVVGMATNYLETEGAPALLLKGPSNTKRVATTLKIAKNDYDRLRDSHIARIGNSSTG
jgi:hypothetical protein